MTEYPYMVEGVWAVPRRLTERHGVVTLDLSVPRVSFFCREKSHFDDPWFVASFVVRAAGPGPRWVMDANYPTREGTGFWIGRGFAGNLVGDEPAGQDVMAPYDPNFRVRYNLRCETCGLAQTRRADELNDDLDALWGANIREMSVADYMFFVRKTPGR